MTTFRVARRSRFTVIDRDTVNDEALSFKARGVLLWLLDKPDDWRCTSEEIARAGTEGRDAIRSALRELEDARYLIRTRVQDEAGHWSTAVTVYERPHTEDGIPGVGQPDVGRPDVGEPGALENTDTGALEPTTTPSTNAPSRVRSVALTEEESLAFETFWRMYGRIGPKQVAAQCWLRAVRSGVDPEVILDGLERWVRYWQTPGAAAVKWPQGWLNERRWEADTPPTQRQVTGPPRSAGQSALEARRALIEQRERERMGA